MKRNNSNRCPKRYLLKGGAIGGVSLGAWVICSMILASLFYDTAIAKFVKQTMGAVFYMFEPFFHYLVSLGLFNQHNAVAAFALFTMFVICIGAILGVVVAYLKNKISYLKHGG